MRKWNWQFKVSIKREASFLFSIFNTQSSIRPNTRPSPVPPANEYITHELLNTTHTMDTSHTNYWTPPTQWTHHTRTTEHHPHNEHITHKLLNTTHTMELTHHTQTTEHHPHNEHITHKLLNTTHTMNTHTNYWTPPTQWTHHTWTTEHHPHNGTAGIPEPPTVSCPNCTRTRDGAKGEGEEADADWTTSVRSYRWMFPSSSPTLSTPATNMIKATELIHLVYNLTAPYNSVRLGCSLLWALWAHPSVSQTQYKQ